MDGGWVGMGGLVFQSTLLQEERQVMEILSQILRVFQSTLLQEERLNSLIGQ